MPPLCSKASEVDNLYIGSSMFRQGLDINTLDLAVNNETLDDRHFTNYILAYNGNQPVFEYIELQNLLEHNVRIQNLYLDMYVYSAIEPPDLDDEKLLMELPLSKKIQVYAATKSDISYWVNTFVSANNDFLFTLPANKYVINSSFKNGGSQNVSGGSSADILDNYPVLNSKPDINQAQKEALENIIKLAKDNDINLIFIETPKYNTVLSSECYSSGLYNYKKILDDNDIKYILCGEDYQFDTKDATMFQDTIHLSYTGKLAFSQILGELLND